MLPVQEEYQSETQIIQFVIKKELLLITWQYFSKILNNSYYEGL